jgi:hypothetical protein
MNLKYIANLLIFILSGYFSLFFLLKYKFNIMKKISIFLLLGLLFFSCEQGYKSESANEDYYAEEEGYEATDEAVPEAAEDFYKNGNQASLGLDLQKPVPEQQSIIPEKMIKEGGIEIEVEEFEKGKEDLNQILRKNNAYISREDQYKSKHEISSDIEIRVANKNFENLMKDLKGIALNVDGKRINLKDVTEEYVDLTARLKAKKKIEERYFEILKQARTIEDILKVEDKLRVIREEIESAEGRLKYLDNKVSLSTINLRLYQEFEFTYTPEKKDGFFVRILRSLDQGWQGLLIFIIGIVNIWPLILIVITIVWWVRRKWRRKRKSNDKGLN